MIDLRCGDALTVLRSLPSESVSAVVTDPPYGQTNEGYDGPIAFGADLWRECFRVAAPNAALISFAGSPTYHKIATAIEAGGWKVRQMWGWVYANGMITSAWPKEGFDRLAPAFDPICYATKSKVLLNLEREGGDSWRRDANSRGRPSFSERTSSHGTTEAVGRWPKSLVASEGVEGFQYFILSANSPRLRAEKTGHPNQKPLPLMQWLVSKLPPSDLPILDPFAGSATTLAAARAEGFDAIGIEQNPDYHALGLARLDADLNATPLFA